MACPQAWSAGGERIHGGAKIVVGALARAAAGIVTLLKSVAYVTNSGAAAGRFARSCLATGVTSCADKAYGAGHHNLRTTMDGELRAQDFSRLNAITTLKYTSTGCPSLRAGS